MEDNSFPWKKLSAIGLFVGLAAGLPVASQNGYISDPQTMVRNAYRSLFGLSVDPKRIKITEFGDYQCPYTKSAEGFVRNLSEDANIEFEFRDFPLPFHKYSLNAAIATEVARKQGKFERYRRNLISNQHALERDGEKAIFAVAELTGCEMDKFRKDYENLMDQGYDAPGIKEDLELAKREAVDSTPTFIFEFNGKSIRVNGDNRLELQKTLDKIQNRSLE